jgi:hypothetical protein
MLGFLLVVLRNTYRKKLEPCQVWGFAQSAIEPMWSTLVVQGLFLAVQKHLGRKRIFSISIFHEYEECAFGPSKLKLNT